MQFLPARSNCSPHVKPLVHKLQSLSFGARIGFFVTNQELDLLRNEAADRGLTPGGEDLGLFEDFPAQTDRHVLFPVIS